MGDNRTYIGQDMTYNFCTYFDSNYLSRGIAMYRSLLRVSQNFKLWILCFDELTYKLLLKMNLKNVELIPSVEFEDEDLLKVKKDRSLVEYFWTCTPSLPLYILNKYPQLSMITYIDADLYFYNNPSVIFEEFNTRSILLTEHRYAKNKERKTKNHGRYNVQFVTFRNDKTGREALEWWRERCLEWCYIKAIPGKMGDQKYLDDWVERFPNVCVLQNKGAGLAPWNIMNYNIKKTGDKILVDNDRLIFYHFHHFKIYGRNIFNLSHYRIPDKYKKIIYAPYIKAIREALDYIKSINKSFCKGYSSFFRFGNIKDVIWLLVSIIEGNFLWFLD
ncbi:MAG: glycosyl transferase [bacterium]|nr:glycosyl transferase [bacterium]